MKMITAVTLSLLLWACRFGGPSGTATKLVEPVDDAATSDTPVPSDDELPVPADNDSTGHSSVGTDPPPAPNDGGTASGACQPPKVQGCDPVRGTGCIPGVNQCVVDAPQAQPSGHCIISGGAADAGCEENILYSTCAPLFTCVQGSCRKYCYCDSDCDPGDSCSEPSGQGSATVFRLCAKSRS